MSRFHLSWFYGWIKLSRHKAFEYEWGHKFAEVPFEFSIRWTNSGDHAGLRFAFSIYKLFFLYLAITDDRYWCYEEGRFYTEMESAAIAQEWAELDEQLHSPQQPAVLDPLSYQINSLGDRNSGKLN